MKATVRLARTALRLVQPSAEASAVPSPSLRLLSSSRTSGHEVQPRFPTALVPPFSAKLSAVPPRLAARGFHSSVSRASTTTQEYTDAPEGYSRPQSSKSRGPWYKSPTTLVLGFIPIFTFGLGYWQIKRLKWKVNLIEELEDKLSQEPLRLPKNINLDVLPEFDFRLVSLEGVYDHSRTMFLGPRVREGVMGYHVVTPFRRSEGGGMVLVNRGFVSEKEIIGQGLNRRLKEEAMPSGETEFVALLPRIYPPNAFTPKNDPDKKLWFHANPAQMAEWASQQAGVTPLSLTPSPADESASDSYTPSAGVADSVKGMLGLGSKQDARVLPVFLEEVFDGNVGEAAIRVSQGVPVGRAATIELRNQHAVYAATWFSLSACTAVMFGLLVRRGRG
ncbi:hypothetical protein BCV70DRAFT_187784 [Testicularia cyperi]|uniref:SURF1-like protein n=1 Tax=Testicularia cyperi TaxID=1882483 RepID=A0A317XT13_9BASI|nr:hypothetical protein BCV70DRAFT_187784 [Testicularia cyperi]